MRGLVFWSALGLILLLGVLATKTVESGFFFFAGYAILQATIMAVAWNILGGFTGYVNFGSAGFFAIGAYTSIALANAFEPPLIVPLLVAALLGGLVGLGTGYLTLRLRGVYFAIATLAMAIVFETFVNNWAYVGAATGAYILTPEAPFFFDSYIEFLFALILFLPMIGGSATWYGPVVGALLLGSIQEVATVTISSEINVLIVGVLLVAFIMVAPQGIVGLVQASWRRLRPHG